ncbi:FH2 domain-containing protein 1 [Liparis tanakae]|uniref:FH2 domain-containing protein 1 n=1 Tax=Liparis tanakae TaxID=230148 RepID=A0A4Z2IB14_9TELE|nr:FH2 domain-containing protein 1 [Liparis tanakae]
MSTLNQNITITATPSVSAHRPTKDMIEDIKSGSSLGFGSGKLKELCKLLPDEGEGKQLVSFKGDPSTLPEADLFMLMLVKIPSYEERLNSLVLKEEFFPLMNEIKECIGTLTAAGKEVLESDNLHSVIRLVLKTGNYMNAGGYAGSAIGFRMASLLKLVDTKANKPGMNLMHYVQAQKAEVDLLKFTDQLEHIEAAARMNKSEIEAEFEKQVRKVQAAKVDTLKQEDLKVQMEDFLKEAEVCLAEIENDLQELQSVSDSVAEYFCENPNTFKLEECFSIFNSFCERFMRAMQENKAREVAEVQRRHRDRLQSATKRRSTATCSSRDKEMDGIALQSILKNFLTKGVSRRRPGRPSSTHGSPTDSSPNNESLSEIISQVNLPTGKPIGGSFRANDMGRKEWNSAVELTENFSQKQDQSIGEENKAKGVIPSEQGGQMSRTEDASGLTHPANKTTTNPFAGKSFSAAADDGEEDLQDNSEEEAQRLREASKKVLRFQNSRSSVSSDDCCLDNKKSPIATVPRQRTFDEDTERYPEDSTNEDFVKMLLNPQSSSKRNLDRRHTLATNVLKTEEEEDDLCTKPPVRTPNSAAREKRPLSAEGAGQNPSKPVFDFTDTSHNLNKTGAQDHNPLSVEKTNIAVTHVTDEGLGEQNKVGKSVDSTDNESNKLGENVPPKSPWIKTENSGLFFSFLKRLGDMSKPPSIKETVYKGPGSGV